MEIVQAPISTRTSQTHFSPILLTLTTTAHSHPHQTVSAMGRHPWPRARTTRPRPHACEMLTVCGVAFGAGILVLLRLQTPQGVD
ncbi:hypothetical protein CGRA01v4_12054 [Colletotrichum graminicola]|nr:hypothetical protein CGRA01v4_12054 [Colletotrichum graminicola]